MNTEAKVGIFTLAALALFAFIVVELTGLSWGMSGNYPLHVAFGNVTGLRPGNLVKYAGVDIGRVERIVAQQNGAVVELMIEQGNEIPKNALITIGADGIMGEKFISVLPPSGTVSAATLQPGETVAGMEQQGIEQIVAAANLVLQDIHTLVQSMNQLFGDERLQSSVWESAQNIREMTANMNRLTAVMAKMAVDNESDIRAMIADFRQIGDNMSKTTARIDSMLQQIDNDGQTARDLCEALANINATSRRIEHMAAAMEGVVTDPETADDLKATLKNVRNVSDKANQMLDKAAAIKIESGVDVMYSGGADEYKVNTDTKIRFNDEQYLLLGVNDLGEENYKNLQFGTWNGDFGGRAGLIDDKAGVGIDKAWSDTFNLSVDAYDPNDFKVKLRAAYEFAEETYLIGEVDQINDSRQRETFVGLRKTF